MSQVYGVVLFKNIMKNRLLNSGFTLMELLVAIAIIAILTSIGFGTYAGVQKKSRDAQRKSDLNQLTRALELFYSDFGRYPESGADGRIDADVSTGEDFLNWGETFDDPSGNQIYMGNLPLDSQNPGVYYFYESNSIGSKFRVFTKLENEDDLQIIPDPDDPDDPPLTAICSVLSDACNFGLSSNNSNLTEIYL